MKILLRLLLLPPLLALAGCCANSASDCQDTLADALYFVFTPTTIATDSTFSVAEVDTVYLLRYNPANAGATYDSLLLTQRQLRLNQRHTPLLAQKLQMASLSDTLKNTVVVLSNAYPFRPGTTGGKLSDYYYTLLIKDKSMQGTVPPKTYAFYINQIALTGQYKADGCRTCYENTKKQLNVNGKLYDVTEPSGGGESSVPVPIPLTKPR